MASPPLIRNGISYVTARAAAPGAGISADYITKLCRRGEVNAVVVGTTWYVDEASLAGFVARTKAAKKAQAELNAQQLKEVARRAQAAEQQPQHQQQPSISLAQQLLNDKAARAAAFAHRQAKYRLPRPNTIALATITLLIATSAAALGTDTLRTHIAETASQLPPHASAVATSAATFATAFKEKLTALTLPQLPSAKPAQLAQAQTSLAHTLTQKIRNFFCRFISGCTTGSLAVGTPPTRANPATNSRIVDENASNIGGQDHATNPENVNPAQASTQTAAPATINASSATAGSASSPASSPIQYLTISGITEALLTSRLAELESSLFARIDRVAANRAAIDVHRTDNVADNLSRLTDRYAASFDTNSLSADAATLGSLSVTSDANIGGDLTVDGTITGGVLNVAGISSQGALIGPYVTATSTAATSTFAGALAVDGRVGIGTTTPIEFAMLYINRASALANIVLDTEASNNSSALEFARGGALTYSLYNYFDDNALNIWNYDLGADQVSLRASGDISLSGGALVTQWSTGNVGIGTTNPQYKLDVLSDDNGFTRLGRTLGAQLVAGGDLSKAQFGTVNNFGIEFLTNGSAKAVLTSGGKVGIGTTTPDTALTIHNASVPNANGQNVLKLQGAITAGTIGSGPRIVFTSTGASSGLEVADIRAYTFGASNTGLTFGTGGGGTITTRMAIDGSGNVGIGTTSPWKTLSVVGTMSVNGLTLNTGAASASLCLSSSNEVTRNTDNESCITSSARYKHDIQSLVGTTTLSTLLALRPVSFEYNETPGIRYGLIAEEVDAIDPTLVGYDDEGKPNSVRYTSVIPLLIQAVQEITNITGQSKQNLIAWLADAQNGITDLFAKHLHAENITADTGTFGTVSADRFEGQEVCAKASGGSLVCLTADQFAAMLSQFAGAAAATSGASSPSNIPTPPAQNPEQEDGQTDDATASETNNTTTQNPSPDSAPDLTDSAQSPAANWTPEEPANDNNPSPDASGDSPPPVSNAPGSTPSSTAGTASSPTVANDNAPSPTESAI